MKFLIWEVHLVSVLREILNVFGLNSLVQVVELAHLAASDEFHLESPNDRDAHTLSSVGYDSTSE